MNILTIVLWLIIAAIGIISIILVKGHYNGKQIGTGGKEKLSEGNVFDDIISSGKNKIKPEHNAEPTTSLYPNSAPNYQDNTYIEPQKVEYEVFDTIERDDTDINYEYKNPNQVLIDYGNKVEKFQEPIKPNQMDIMTQNNKDKTELKDLFTIDELIKESKRKDSEREKQSQKISSDDEDLEEIKESIKKHQQEQGEEPLIEEIVEQEIKEGTISEILNETEPAEEKITDIVNEEVAEETASEVIEEEEKPIEETINTLINDTDAEEVSENVEEPTPEIVPPSTSQKDIEEAITTASEEIEEEVESISESDNITDILLNADDDSQDIPNEEIKEPTLKTPNKIEEVKADPSPIDDNKMDLDYRKDLDKIANKIKGSKIFQDVKDKIVQEIGQDETEYTPEDESYIRNVNEFDEFEPIINETHVDFDASYEDLHTLGNDATLREQNTRRVFKMAKNTVPEPELATEKVGTIKSKPSRDNIKINLNNSEVVLKKGDEIIFNHAGETYSSKVFAINGDDISVRYRRKDITIKPQDVKKIY